MFKNKDYVLAVYREGGFTKAAEKLFVSQPSLSSSIKRIEEKISAPIFDRATSPVGLTEVGREYVKYALEIEQKEKDFERYVSDHTSLIKGKIKIGGSSFFSSFVLPALISDFKEKHSKIEFEIFEDSTKNLMYKLNGGELDIVIDNAINKDENITSKIYKSETLLLAVPTRFIDKVKIDKKGFSAQDVKNDLHMNAVGVSITNFESLPFILLHHENDTGARAEKIFKHGKVTPNVVFTLDQQVTAHNLSSTGLGITFVSDTLVKYSGAEKNLVYYKLADRTINRTVYFYQKKNRYLSLASQKFIEYYSKDN